MVGNKATILLWYLYTDRKNIPKKLDKLKPQPRSIKYIVRLEPGKLAGCGAPHSVEHLIALVGEKVSFNT